MIKVTCQLNDMEDSKIPGIKVHSHWKTKRNVELEIEGKRYVVNGQDLITAVENAMSTNSLC